MAKFRLLSVVLAAGFFANGSLNAKTFLMGKDGGGGDAIICSQKESTLAESPQTVALLDYYDIENGKLAPSRYFAHKGFAFLNQMDRDYLHAEITKAFNTYGEVVLRQPHFGDRLAKRISEQRWIEDRNLPELADDQVLVKKRPNALVRSVWRGAWVAAGIITVVPFAIDMFIDTPGKLDMLGADAWPFACKKVQLAIQDVKTNTIRYNPIYREKLGHFEAVGLQWHEALLGEHFPDLAGVDTTEVRQMLHNVLFEATGFISTQREKYWAELDSRLRPLWFYTMVLSGHEPRSLNKNKIYQRTKTAFKGWDKISSSEREKIERDFQSLTLKDLRRALSFYNPPESVNSEYKAGLDRYVENIRRQMEARGFCETFSKSKFYSYLNELVRNGDDRVTLKEIAEQIFNPGQICAL